MLMVFSCLFHSLNAQVVTSPGGRTFVMPTGTLTIKYFRLVDIDTNEPAPSGIAFRLIKNKTPIGVGVTDSIGISIYPIGKQNYFPSFDMVITRLPKDTATIKYELVDSKIRLGKFETRFDTTVVYIRKIKH